VGLLLSLYYTSSWYTFTAAQWPSYPVPESGQWFVSLSIRLEDMNVADQWSVHLEIRLSGLALESVQLKLFVLDLICFLRWSFGLLRTTAAGVQIQIASAMGNLNRVTTPTQQHQTTLNWAGALSAGQQRGDSCQSTVACSFKPELIFSLCVPIDISFVICFR
jgi:hypothetical protein